MNRDEIKAASPQELRNRLETLANSLGDAIPGQAELVMLRGETIAIIAELGRRDGNGGRCPKMEDLGEFSLAREWAGWPEQPTLRDRLAMAASDEDIRCMIFDNERRCPITIDKVTPDVRAKFRYEWADAMLKARGE